MTRDAEIAAIETDLAFVLNGLDAVDDLEALLLLLCQTKLNVEEAERMSEGLARVRRGLTAVRKWGSWVRNGRHLRSRE